jgi:hypothetical protein
MPSHKFKVGDLVTVNPAISRFVPGGVFEVIKQLPGNGERQYRSLERTFIERFKATPGMVLVVAQPKASTVSLRFTGRPGKQTAHSLLMPMRRRF